MPTINRKAQTALTKLADAHCVAIFIVTLSDIGRSSIDDAIIANFSTRAMAEAYIEREKKELGTDEDVFDISAQFLSR